MSEWGNKRLIDYWEFNPKITVNKDDEYSFIEMPDLTAGNKHVYPKRKRKAKGLTKFQNGDTLFAKITPCLENGKICQAQGLDNNIGVGSTEFFVFRGRDGVSDNDFIHYLLKWYPIRKYAEKCMSGSAGHQRVPSDAFDEIELPLPDFEESVEIGKTLSNLDQKITLLREQNKTLEELAQTLFKRWFVEFEFPNENGQPYKSSGGKMIESELGEIPEGWRVGDIYKVLKVQYGFPFKSKLFNENGEGLPLIRIRDLKKGKTGFFTPQDFNDDYIVNCGDVLAGMDAEFKPYVWSGNKALLNQRVCRFISEANYSELFIIEFMRPHLNFFERTKVGTTVSHLGKSDLDSIETLIPETFVIKTFSEVVTPIHKMLVNNYKKIQSLTQLRDTLLPKLMSGELKVKELHNGNFSEISNEPDEKHC